MIQLIFSKVIAFFIVVFIIIMFCKITSKAIKTAEEINIDIVRNYDKEYFDEIKGKYRDNPERFTKVLNAKVQQINKEKSNETSK